MSTSPFEYSDDLSELVQQVTKRLEAAGLDPDVLSLVGLTTLARVLENRDDDLTSYLNDGLTAATYQVSDITGTTTVSSTPVAVTWTAEDLSTTSDVSWAASPNPTRVTFSGEGLWLCSAGLGFAAVAAGTRHVEMKKNGASFSPPIGSIGPGSGSYAPLLSTSFQFNATAGDYLEVWITQNTGGGATVSGYFHATYLGSTG